MFSTARVVAFAVSFLLALPIMLALFRGDDGISSQAWMVSAMFAASVAVVVALQFGKGGE